ncbi:hypothetical protein Stsp02_63330 [Streptomyces sp. NBRC 14336]|nr:hypothetical protein Stsp02_63330 [Streptomyces sp. NBRC 14336]
MRPVKGICSTLLHKTFTVGVEGFHRAIPRGETAAAPRHGLGVDFAHKREVHTVPWRLPYDVGLPRESGRSM